MKRKQIERLLPALFQRVLEQGSPLSGVLEVMECLSEPSAELLEHLDRYLDPHRAPDAFVLLLAHWVDLHWLLQERFNRDSAGGDSSALSSEPMATGIGRLRELVAAAAYLSQWRGTSQGLLRFLETATGISGFAIDEQIVGPDGQPLPYRLRLRVPAAAVPYRSLIEKIIEQEKPAYVTFELALEPAGKQAEST